MSNWARQLAAARDQIEIAWTPERHAEVLRAVHATQLRRRRQRRVLVAASATAAMVVLLVAFTRLLPPRVSATVERGSSVPAGPGSAIEAAVPTRLTDGSLVRGLDAASRLQVREERPGRTVIALHAGRARFEVTKNPSRLFRVESGPIAVEVLGTRFVVERLSAPGGVAEPSRDRTRVTVEEGRVRVLWSAQYAELRAGESRIFPASADDEKAAVAPVLRAGAAEDPLHAAPEIAADAARPRALTFTENKPLPEAKGPIVEPASVSVVQKLAFEPKKPATETKAGAAEHAGTAPPPRKAAPVETGVSVARAGAEAGAARGSALGDGPQVTPSPPAATVPRQTAPAEPPAAIHAASASGSAAALAAAATGWRAQAQDGQFEQAYLQAFGSPQGAARAIEEAARSPTDLLLLADVARLSRHPGDAVAPLSRVLREHARDPRAPLAAFTLGRVLLDDLGRPREAAERFHHAQQLDPDGPLAQDALAREVEAWSRAGEAQSARERARLYLERYPGGRRVRSVRRYGELE